MMPKLNKFGAYTTTKYNTIKPDWLRIVVPYPYYSNSLVHGKFASRTNNPVDGVLVSHRELVAIFKKVFSLVTGQAVRHFSSSYQCHLVSNWSNLDCGHDFYRHMFSHLNRNIYYVKVDFSDKNDSGRLLRTQYIPLSYAKMGIMIEYTGQGCREMGQILHSFGSSWQQWFAKVKEVLPTAHCTRIDLCLDVKGGPIRLLRHLTPKAFLGDFKHHHVITSKRHICTVSSAEYHSDKYTQYYEPTGDTVYLGNSPFMLRVYDKQKERYYSHGDTYRNKAKYWIRWEFQNGQTYANQVFDYLANGETFSSVYLNIMSFMFRIVNNASNSRSHCLKWFSEFRHSIASLGDGCLGHDYFHGPFKRCFNSYTSTEWLNGSVSKTFMIKLFAILLMHGNVHVWLQHFIHEGKSKVLRDRNAWKRITQLCYTFEPYLSDGKASDQIFYDCMNGNFFKDRGLIENYKRSDSLGKHSS